MRYKNYIVVAFVFALVGMFALPGCQPDPVEPIDSVDNGPTPYEIDIPPFFAPMDIPEDNPMTVEGIELGRHLFWEKQLSGNNEISCGSCHFPEHGFSDPAQFSTGATGMEGNRHSMALVNLGWARDYFWDSRAMTLEEQIIDPVQDPIEMNQEWDEAVMELQQNSLYPPMFEDAFGDEEVTQDRVTKAIAQFLRTMISADSKFDKWRRGEVAELTQSEDHGRELFITEGGSPEDVPGGQFGADCFHCHGFGDMQFSDYLPHNNGLDSNFSDLGVGGVTNDPLDYGKFKTPTLRNIELTSPYMHDGRFETLEEVIDHYDSGGHPSETLDPFMKFEEGGLNLSDQDKADLIAFLKTLTDTSFVDDPKFSNPHD